MEEAGLELRDPPASPCVLGLKQHACKMKISLVLKQRQKGQFKPGVVIPVGNLNP